ncbi:MAG TPA: acetyl-coenzyme A synthetase, partial [Candidatus Dormibacteraeota bacterium]|nr:acetyl-coenzyme A synthetase [Candidatus Dormibacteraeota bacterium]
TPLPGITSTKPGSATTPFPGIEPAVLTEEGEDAGTEQGLLAIKRPWPGMLRTLYRDDERFVETFFSKWDETTYFVGDAARCDEDGYFWVIGRVDDVINVSGHRMSTAEIESAIVSHPKVAEAACIGQADEDSGQAVCAFVTLQGDQDVGSEDMKQHIREHVAGRIGKFARPKRIIWSGDLPKTRSGKIMRRLLRDVSENRPLGDTTTLADPAVVAELARRGKEEAGKDEQ